MTVAPSSLPWVKAAAWGWLGFILYGTLAIPGDPGSVPAAGACFICGSRGSADALINVAMFAPLGVAVILGVWSSRTGLLLLLLPPLIELVQRTIPGRHASLADVVFNAAGILLGLLGVRFFCWMEERRPGATSVVWGGALTLLVLGAGYLQRPHLPDARYFANWNPDLRTVDPYPGPVTAASVEGIALPSGPLEASTEVRAALERGAPVEVTFVGASTRGDGRLRGIFGIWDGGRREVLMVGVRDTQPVVRGWSLARHLRFNHWTPPTVSAGFAMEGAGESTLELRWSARDGPCMAWDGNVACEPMLDAGQLWSLVLSPPRRLDGRWISTLWLLALSFPFGALPRRRETPLVAGTALLVTAAAPWFLPLAPMGWAGWVWLVVGWSMGRAVGGTASRVFYPCNDQGAEASGEPGLAARG